MKTILLLFAISSLAVAGYAQSSGTVTKRSVEMNKNIDNKKGYNQFLLDMIKISDGIYAEYEELVQRVWDKKVDLNLDKSSNAYRNKIDGVKQTIVDMPIFKGGDDYQKSVLTYMDAVKKKMTHLERLGVLGADENSNTVDYNDAAIAFNEVTNECIDVRNNVRNKKNEFEGKVYIK